MRKGNFEIKVLVNDKPINEYFHDNNHYVEGRRNSEFEIELRNDSGSEVLMVLSVDGLSVLDGKPAGTESRGYIVSPWRSVKVPGWTLDSNQVARFEFKDKLGSYVHQGTGSSLNAGVIGVLVYEKLVPYVRRTVRDNSYCVNDIYRVRSEMNNVLCGFPSGQSPNMGNAQYSVGMSNTSIYRGKTKGIGSIESLGISATASVADSVTASVTNSATVVEPSLGTGFGRASEFKTVRQDFKRGRELERFVLYYDSRKNLERLGIRIAPTSHYSTIQRPNPFPVEGCKPPPGWTP